MSRVSEGLEPWTFENLSKEEYLRREAKKVRKNDISEKKEVANLEEKKTVNRNLAINYWTKFLAALDAASDYIAREKTFLNSVDEERSHKVADVVDKYFEGDPEKLQDRAKYLYSKFASAVIDFNFIAERAKMPTVKILDLLLFWEDKTKAERAKTRRYVRKYIEEGAEPFPALEIESHFRKAKK